MNTSGSNASDFKCLKDSAFSEVGCCHMYFNFVNKFGRLPLYVVLSFKTETYRYMLS
jgi:hypothetical protein